jgi:hypothetical protein
VSTHISTASDDLDHDDKYVVFKRSEFYEMMGFFALPPWNDADGNLIGTDIDCAPITAEIERTVNERSLSDAVVIRRQDYFASPALASYAASIAIAVRFLEDEVMKKRLTRIADYFQRQSELAAEEGWKLPTL